MGQLSQLETHRLAQPSRPTSDALDLSVKRTNFMSVFMYFLYRSMRKRLCLGVTEGLLIALLIKAILTRMRLRVVFAILGSPDSLKIAVPKPKAWHRFMFGALVCRFVSLLVC